MYFKMSYKSFVTAIVNYTFGNIFCVSCWDSNFYRATACNASSSATHAVAWESRPSVRLSVKRVDCDKTTESSGQIFIPYEQKFIVVFRHEEWLVGDDPFYMKFWTKLTPFEQITPICNRYSLVAPQP